MRRIFILLAAAVLLGACRMPYMADYADMTVRPEKFPPVGTAVPALTAWFDAHGYVPGPKILQSEAELRRRPGDPLVYARPTDRVWWRTEGRTVRDLCVTERTIYYRLGASGHLTQAVRTHRSQC